MPPQHDHGPAASPRILALMNQKGGVGKTTTAVNLGAALARLGHSVLLIDLDPQAHLTLHLGINPDEVELSVYDLLTDDQTAVLEVVQQIEPNLAVLPAHLNLAGAEAELSSEMVTGRAQRRLREKCASILGLAGAGPAAAAEAPVDSPFEFVLVDCPPSLGLLTINALTTASEVIVPMQPHYLALQGLAKLIETVQLVRQSFNPRLEVGGVVLCMHEQQTILAQEVVADLTGFLEQGREQDVPWRQARVFQPPVRRNIKLAECPSFGKTIFDYAPGCAGAQDYLAVARDIAGDDEAARQGAHSVQSGEADADQSATPPEAAGPGQPPGPTGDEASTDRPGHDVTEDEIAVQQPLPEPARESDTSQDQAEEGPTPDGETGEVISHDRAGFQP